MWHYIRVAFCSWHQAHLPFWPCGFFCPAASTMTFCPDLGPDDIFFMYLFVHVAFCLYGVSTGWHFVWVAYYLRGILSVWPSAWVTFFMCGGVSVRCFVCMFCLVAFCLCSILSSDVLSLTFFLVAFCLQFLTAEFFQQIGLDLTCVSVNWLPIWLFQGNIFL